MSPRIPLVQVDAFTGEPLHGNPAAVCRLDSPRDDAWLQAVAAEMNLSETAFLWERDDGFDLRWFTPACEVPLCGHATLASAHALWEAGTEPPEKPLRFFTASGELLAQRRGEEIELDFPALPVSDAVAPPEVLRVVPAPVENTAQVRKGPVDVNWIIEVESERVVRSLVPELASIRGSGAPGVIVTARGDDEFDFVSRYFVPSAGVDEDPVTGSAHCALAPYWAPRLGRTAFQACQASARGGWLGVELSGERVLLRGRAVTVLRGELTL